LDWLPNDVRELRLLAREEPTTGKGQTVPDRAMEATD
jgi:hypothetical protein